MRKTSLFMMLLLILCAIGPASAADAANRPVVPSGFATPGEWLRGPDASSVILSPTAIQQYNGRIRQSMPTTVFDLTAYPAALDRQTLTKYLSAAEMSEDELFVNGQVMSADYRSRLLQAVNRAGVRDSNPVRYGFTVKRTNVRTFPTLDGVFDSPSDREFDNFQETVADPAEPVIILHQSEGGDFYYIQMYNYRGWVAASHVALTPSRDTWLSYQRADAFLIVRDSTVSVTTPGGPVLFQMGAKIPLESGATGDRWQVRLPARTEDGQLTFQSIDLPKNASFSTGYLPYTRENIVQQAFVMLGDPYGWGGLRDSVDCSSFIANIYRTMGIYLPRNADQQETAAGKYYALTGKSKADRLSVISKMPAGSAVFMDGHVMLYLGTRGGVPYIIHSLGSHTRFGPNGTKEKIRVMEVVVSDLLLTRANGRTFLEELTSGKDFR